MTGGQSQREVSRGENNSTRTAPFAKQNILHMGPERSTGGQKLYKERTTVQFSEEGTVIPQPRISHSTVLPLSIHEEWKKPQEAVNCREGSKQKDNRRQAGGVKWRFLGHLCLVCAAPARCNVPPPVGGRAELSGVQESWFRSLEMARADGGGRGGGGAYSVAACLSHYH